MIDSHGLLQREITIASPDDEVTVHIPSGTAVLDEYGDPLNEISVVSTEPPSAVPEDYHLLKAFNFSPDGAIFDPGMEIVISFDPAEVPKDGIVVLAFFNVNKGEWQLIEGEVNPSGIAAFTIAHFSTYALVYQVDSSSEASAHSDKGLSTNELIAIVIATVLTIAVIVTLIILHIKGRRLALGHVEKRRKTVKG